jgi:metal-dependent amidase/aminoacylase/carboxypeptidase family protein
MVSSDDPFVLSMTSFNTGEAYTVYHDTAKMQGSFFVRNNDTKKLVLDKIKEIVESTVSMFGC